LVATYGHAQPGHFDESREIRHDGLYTGDVNVEFIVLTLRPDRRALNVSSMCTFVGGWANFVRTDPLDACHN